MELGVGAMTIDLVARVALQDGCEVRLAPREFSVLAHLARHRGRIVGREELLRAVWRLRHDPGTNVVEVQVARLRAKLGSAAPAIETVRGEGYRLAG